MCQIYNKLKYIIITSNQNLFRNFEFCFFLFVFNKSASILTLLNITPWNYNNYESGNQNSENTCFASQTKSTVLLIFMEFEKKSSCQNMGPDPNQKIRTFDSGMAEIQNWHFLVNPFSFVIGILKASPLCTYIYTFPWYRNFKFWNPVDPNPKTLCHQAYLRFGMRIAILFIAGSLLALTETLWPVLS